jgi:hypothetical protein
VVVSSVLSNAGGSVTITANNRILRSASNADGVNIVADSGESHQRLWRFFQTAARRSARLPTATSSLSATVNGTASYGGISIQNFGAQPGTISLTDNAANPANVSGGKASISFYNSGNLAVGAGTTFSNGVNNGDIAITSGGSLDYTGGLASTSGGILLGAKAGLTMSSGLSTAGLLQLTAGTTLDVDSSIGGSYVTLVAPTINVTSSVNATNDAILTGSTIKAFELRVGVMRAAVAVMAASVLCIPAAHAATAGQVTHLSGTLSAKKPDGTSKLLSVKSDVLEGDTLSTESETYARIKFNDGGEVVLRPGSQLKIESYAYNAAKPESDNIVMNMFKGGLRAVTGLVGKRNREKVTFQTETATIGIRGTHFGACCARTTAAACPPREASRLPTGCMSMSPMVDRDDQRGRNGAAQCRSVRIRRQCEYARRSKCRRSRAFRYFCFGTRPIR